MRQNQTAESLILRTDPVGGLVDTGRFVEFSVLQRLRDTDLPTPNARWVDRDGRRLGRPSLVMERLPGICDYHVLYDPARSLEEHLELARTFCELLARVHAVRWKELGMDTVLYHPGGYGARAELDAWNSILIQDQLDRIHRWADEVSVA